MSAGAAGLIVYLLAPDYFFEKGWGVIGLAAGIASLVAIVRHWNDFRRM